mmetsp:Transcript_22740/g.42259  ORF Transcript_22740/g.42259 Transcript_22740/m.42259 type:complete len:158 (-) Transcript_22740:53-526(-)
MIPQAKVPRKSRRSPHHVRFAEMTDVKTIDTFGLDEDTESLWYTREETRRSERLHSKLTDELQFYTEEQLFDRFGLQPKERMAERRKRTQIVHLCMYLIKQQGCIWKPETYRQPGCAAALYDRECEACARDAHEWAKMVELQVRYPSRVNKESERNQ